MRQGSWQWCRQPQQGQIVMHRRIREARLGARLRHCIAAISRQVDDAAPPGVRRAIIVQFDVVPGGQHPSRKQSHHRATIAAGDFQRSDKRKLSVSIGPPARRIGRQGRFAAGEDHRRHGCLYGQRHSQARHQASYPPARGLRSRIHGTTGTGRALRHFVAPGKRARAGRQPVQPHAHRHNGEFHPLWSELRAVRNPMLLLRFVGLLLRFATRKWFVLLFHLPPRFTRFLPDGRRPEFFHHAQPETARAHRHDESR
jgi:hypothetical protein